MTKKISVTVGISAYNEEANIKNLLDSILSQKQDNFILEEIIVISDGSTDRTTDLVMSMNNSKIKLIINKLRIGKSQEQNRIFSEAKGDIIVMLDADVVLKSNNVLQEFIKPIASDSQVGLVSMKTEPLPANNFFQKVINFSVMVKTEIFESINQADNIFLCHGMGRAFSKSFAREIEWPGMFSEDAYSYLLCKLKGFKFVYNRDGVLLFRAPGNLQDHKRQSDRFKGGVDEISKYLPRKFVLENYRIPFGLMFKHALISFFEHPILLSTYLLIRGYEWILGSDVYNQSYLWPISGSSKSLKQDNI